MVETLKEIESRLLAQKSPSPRADALALLGFVLKKPSEVLLAEDSYQLGRQESRQLRRLVRKRPQVAIAHLVGGRYFYDDYFLVSKNTLVPRPDSEDLVQLALEIEQRQQPKAVYDLGCGSGCLGISYSRASWRKPPLTLVDKSSKALAVCLKNQKKLNCPGRRVNQDLVKLKPDFYQPDSLILANLPYLPRRQKKQLIKNCPEIGREPKMALWQKGEGLNLYQKLFKNLGQNPKFLVIEALVSQQPKLLEIARNYHWRLLKKQRLALAFVNNRSNGLALPIGKKQNNQN